MPDVRSMVMRQPVVVDRSTTIRDAAKVMERQGVGALVVVDQGRLVGIVTDRDVVLRGVAPGVPDTGRIDSLMTTDVLTVPARADIDRAYEIFRDNAIRRLPVLDGREVVGLISVDDLLIRSEREMSDLTHALRDEMLAPHREAGPIVPTGAGTSAGEPVPSHRRARQARPGDTLVVHWPRTNHPDRIGEICEVRSPAGDPPFTVRWSDTGHVSFVYPGPDAEVRHQD